MTEDGQNWSIWVTSYDLNFLPDFMAQPDGTQPAPSSAHTPQNP